MKKLCIYFLSGFIFFSACKPKTTVTSDDGNTKVSVDLENVQNTADEMNKKIEELKKLTPLTVAQLKAMLPEELLGIKRTNFNSTSAMGFATAEAEYQKDDTTSLHLTIWDCAGEAGSGIYALNYWTKMSMESESEDGYTKTVEFMGGKAIEDYKKYNEAYTLTYTSNDRLMVTMKGEHIPVNTLKDAAKALNLNVSN